MASNAVPRPLLSIVITVRNEERHIAALLESLRVQEPPFEILLVDANSQDRTVELVRAFQTNSPGLLQLIERPGSRGIGRNVGVDAARGEAVVFIDGDCEADPNWLGVVRHGLTTSDVVAGRTVTVGPPRYQALERVELYQLGNDVTYPSCNLAYPRELFRRLGGFDPRFITAEDIDLNLRAVRAGARLRYLPEAMVRHHVRPTMVRFLIQAFWNGYGRKQLTEKHGALWGNYRVRRLVEGQRRPLAWFRLAGALAGYAT
ncbi:MAG: glycosyltransferase, partial [Thermoplasmata archaeon]|nr:glycosyltransferase [Thermoplasmata archaeon]